MKVVEDFESRPHKAVSFVVEREKEVLEWNEQKLPKVLPGYSGGRLPGRSTKEAGREEEKAGEDGEKKEGSGVKLSKVSSYLQTHMVYGKYACMGHSPFIEKFWASVKETRAAIMKSGYTWTFLVTDAHGSRRNHDHRVLLKERSCPYPPNTEKSKYDGGSDHSLSSLSSTRDLN